MYSLSIRDAQAPDGIRVLRSEEIARMVAENRDGNPEVMRHLSAIERLEARGIRYANQDFDVLNAAYDFAVSPHMTPERVVPTEEPAFLSPVQVNNNRIRIVEGLRAKIAERERRNREDAAK